MTVTNLTRAELYYQAMGEKNSAKMAQFLDEAATLKNPQTEVLGKEAILAAANGLFRFLNKISFRAKFSQDDQVMLVMDFDCAQPIGLSHTASLLTFRNERIVRIELFLDFRPYATFFEKR